MAWRVSCAALWATAMLRQADREGQRGADEQQRETGGNALDAVSEVVEEIVRAVMNTLRGDQLKSLSCGRSPDLRVAEPRRPSRFPSGQILPKPSPLTVAGAVTDSAPIGSSSPCSLLGPRSVWLRAPHSDCSASLTAARQLGRGRVGVQKRHSEGLAVYHLSILQSPSGNTFLTLLVPILLAMSIRTLFLASVCSVVLAASAVPAWCGHRHARNQARGAGLQGLAVG